MNTKYEWGILYERTASGCFYKIYCQLKNYQGLCLFYIWDLDIYKCFYFKTKNTWENCVIST